MDSERMSFEEASRELGITEEELEELVAAGEIASVKEGDTIYFKKGVVQKFKKHRKSNSPTILLADDEIDLLEEEGAAGKEKEPTKPVGKVGPAGAKKKADEEEDEKPARIEISLDDDLNLDDIEVSATPVAEKPTETETKKVEPAKAAAQKKSDVADDETLINLDGLLEDDSEGTTPVPAAADADSTLLDTEDMLDVASLSSGTDPFAADTVEETASGTDLTEAGTLLRGGGARVMQMKRKKSHALWTVALALSAILLIFPVGVLTNLLFLHSPQTREAGTPSADSYSWIMDFNFLGGAVETVADIFATE